MMISFSSIYNIFPVTVHPAERLHILKKGASENHSLPTAVFPYAEHFFQTRLKRYNVFENFFLQDARHSLREFAPEAGDAADYDD